MTFIRGAHLLLGLLLLAGCQGRSNHPAAGTDAENFFPLVEGAQWVYEIRTAQGNFKVISTARGVKKLPGDQGEVFIVDEKTQGAGNFFVETQPVGYYLNDEGYLARLTALDYDDEDELMMVGVEEPAWFLPADPQLGHTWGQITKMFQTPDGTGGDLGWSGEVKASSDVTVPAGEFKDAIEIRLTYSDPGAAGEQTRLFYHDYYVRGVGLVRSVVKDPAGDDAKTIETVLLSFEFPG